MKTKFALILISCFTATVNAETLRCQLPDSNGQEVTLFFSLSESGPRMAMSEVLAGGLEMSGIPTNTQLCKNKYATNLSSDYPFPKKKLGSDTVFQFACANGDVFQGQVDLSSCKGYLWSPYNIQLSKTAKYNRNSIPLSCSVIGDSIWDHLNLTN